MYCEIYGEGTPIVLIHGGLGGIVEFHTLIPRLAATQQVIAVELQGHGHTADIDRPLSFEQLADDIAALIAHLGYEKADILGYSLGSSVALQTAIRHPNVVNRLTLISPAFRRSGIHPEFRSGMEALNPEAAQAMLETPMYQFYASAAPRPDDWPVLVGKVGDLMRIDYDWTDGVQTITAPTLIVVGDADFVPPAHAVELFGLLGGAVAGGFADAPNAQLAVLPATNHFSVLSNTDLLLPILTSFLGESVPQNP